MGHDEEDNNVLKAIEFSRIKGGKCFELSSPWFVSLLQEIGQPPSKPAVHFKPPAGSSSPSSGEHGIYDFKAGLLEAPSRKRKAMEVSMASPSDSSD